MVSIKKLPTFVSQSKNYKHLKKSIMNLVFTMTVSEFESVQNMKSVNALLKKYDAVPMTNDINLMGFYKQG